LDVRGPTSKGGRGRKGENRGGKGEGKGETRGRGERKIIGGETLWNCSSGKMS